MAVEERTDEDNTPVAMAISLTTNDILSIGRSPLQVRGEARTKERNAEDDELTSLAWLQDSNLLKNFQMGPYPMEEEALAEETLSDSPSSDYLEDTMETITISREEEDDPSSAAPSLSPYNPSNASSKPPFSFSCLIFMAIEDSLNKALPVKDIYSWILTHFPYFQNAPTGWKNSVRHNLSLSKCFRKVEKEKGQNVGKGSLWCIDPEFRPNLLQALHKAPIMANLEFSRFSCTSPSTLQNGKDSESKPTVIATQDVLKIPSPELFPFLSRRLASTIKDPEVDAAATMLTLKHGPDLLNHSLSEESENDSDFNHMRKRLRHHIKYHSPAAKRSKVSKPVITTSPSEDHTYSACVEGQDAHPSPDNTTPSINNSEKVSEPSKITNGGCSNSCISLRCDPYSETNCAEKNAEEEGAHALMNLAEIASKRFLRNINGRS